MSFYSDTMDNWDEKKLEEVVKKKHGEAEKKKPKTQIVCPFLELSCCGIYYQGELYGKVLMFSTGLLSIRKLHFTNISFISWNLQISLVN